MLDFAAKGKTPAAALGGRTRRPNAARAAASRVTDVAGRAQPARSVSVTCGCTPGSARPALRPPLRGFPPRRGSVWWPPPVPTRTGRHAGARLAAQAGHGDEQPERPPPGALPAARTVRPCRPAERGSRCPVVLQAERHPHPVVVPDADAVRGDHAGEPLGAVRLAPQVTSPTAGATRPAASRRVNTSTPTVCASRWLLSDGADPVGAPPDTRKVDVGVVLPAHEGGAEPVENVVLALAELRAGARTVAEPVHQPELAEPGQPVLGGVAVGEEAAMDLTGGQHRMPTQQPKDLPIPTGQRARHVVQQRLGGPPRRRTRDDATPNSHFSHTVGVSRWRADSHPDVAFTFGHPGVSGLAREAPTETPGMCRGKRRPVRHPQTRRRAVPGCPGGVGGLAVCRVHPGGSRQQCAGQRP